MLAALILAAAGVSLGGALTRVDIGLVFLALYGWIGGLALTQLYKIVPFLTWLDQFGSRLGKERTPRVQDLVNERRDRYAFWVYFLATALAGLSLANSWLTVFRLAMLVAFVATLDLVRALYRAAHPPQEDWVPTVARQGTRQPRWPGSRE